MSRYMVTATLTISVHTVVEAANANDAYAEALDRPVMSLPAGCSGDELAEWVHSGELDGDPDETSIVVGEVES